MIMQLNVSHVIIEWVGPMNMPTCLQVICAFYLIIATYYEKKLLSFNWEIWRFFLCCLEPITLNFCW